MALRTGLLLALLLLAPAAAHPAPALPGLPADVRVDITADRLVSDEAGRAEAPGDVRLQAGPFRVAAQHAVYDPDTSLLVADGDVTLVSGGIAVRASRVSIDLAQRQGVLERAAMFEKTEPLGIEEAASASLEELRDAGRNTLQVEADRLVIEREGSLVAFDPTVTTCDCGDDTPVSWTVGAQKAVIVPGVSLRLHWPVLRARGVPVAAFPYLSLPLQPRKTGFLPPRVSPNGRNGFGYEQDFFVVLGESYDATLGADYFNGDYYDGQYRSFRGTRARTEFRYAPRVGTYGRAYLAFAHDTTTGQANSNRTILPEDRWNFALDQTDNWGFGFSDRIAVGLVSDRGYLNDFTDSVILRGEQTVRSTSWFAHRAGESLVVADVQYVQDLRGKFEPTGVQTPGVPWGTAKLFGENTRRPFQRLPGLAFDLVHVPVGPAEFDLRLGLERYDPVIGVAFDDVGEDALGPGDFYYLQPDAGEDDGAFGPGETSATTRLSLRPAVSVPLAWDPYLSVVPYAAYRFLGYGNDVGGDGERQWAYLGASARTELTRTYGPKERRIRHTIGPRLELRRLVPGDEKGTPRETFDLYDVGPRRPETQGRVALWQRLAGKSPLGNIALELELGEELLVAPEATRWEDFAELDAWVGPAELQLRLRFDPETYSTRETMFRTNVNFRYVSLSLGYNQLAAGASARLLAGTDELFGTEPRFPELDAVETVAPGITVRPVEGLAVSYGATYLWPLDDWLQRTLAISYSSPCNCWSAGIQASYRYNRYAPPQFGDLPSVHDFTISLGGTGSL